MWHTEPMAKVSSRAVPDRTSTIELCPGLLYPRRWNADGTLDADPPVRWKAVIEYNEAGAKFEVRAVEVVAPVGVSLTGDMLRSLQLGELLRRTVKPSSALTSTKKPRIGPYSLLTEDVQARMKEAGPVTETLEMVAWIYRTAFAVGDSPTKQVADAFEIPRPTADRWVRRARDRGLLGDSPQPGKASV